MSIDFFIPGTDLTMNVSNNNGFYILTDILNIDSPDAYGSVSAQHVLACAASYDASRGTKETKTTQGVYLTPEGVSPGATVTYCGRTREQVERYLESLTALAVAAQNKGEEVAWG